MPSAMELMLYTANSHRCPMWYLWALTSPLELLAAAFALHNRDRTIAVVVATWRPVIILGPMRASFPAGRSQKVGSGILPVNVDHFCAQYLA